MLTFNLKKEWFEKIKSGEKTHEYREYKPYWKNRLEKCIGDDFSATRLRFGNTVVIEYPHYITFVCGYAPKGDKNKRLKARLISIRLIDGRGTDLHIDKPVYDIKFELIGDKKMTNKEQIIIDTNKYFVEVIDESKSTIGYYVVHPEGLLREITKQNKQLEHKTQECEELKLKCLGNRNDYLCERQVTKRYRNALEEIEKCINNLKKQDILTFPDFSLQKNCKVIMKQCNEGYRQILDVISKAKGEES